MPTSGNSAKLSLVRSAFYECDLDGSGVSLRISYNLLDRLISTLPPTPLPAAGGLLLGTVPGDGGASNIEDVIGLDWDSPLGAPIPGPSTQRELEWLLRQWAPKAARQLAAVGYYRVAVAQVDHLPEEDQAFLARYFPRQDAYVLLLSPGTDRQYDIQLWRLQDNRSQQASLAYGHKPPAPSAAAPPSAALIPAPPAPVSAKPRWRTWQTGVAAAILTLAFVGISIERRSAMAPTAVEDPGLLLAVQRQGDTLELRWNRSSSLIRNAFLGTIVVTEGESRNHVVLEPEQIRSGRFVYFPSRPDVAFRLEVVSREGGRTSESINTLSGNVPTVASAAMPMLPPMLMPRTSMPEIPNTSATLANISVPVSNKGPEPPVESRTRSFVPLIQTPANAASRVTAPELPTDLAPQIIASNALANSPALAPSLPSYAATPPPPPPPAASPIGTAFTEPPPAVLGTTAAQYRPPSPIRQRSPIVPAAMRGMIRHEVLVALKATVDADGRVTSVKPLNEVKGVSALLIPVAIDALERWRFDPARRNGDPIPGEAVVQFRFRASDR